MDVDCAALDPRPPDNARAARAAPSESVTPDHAGLRVLQAAAIADVTLPADGHVVGEPQRQPGSSLQPRRDRVEEDAVIRDFRITAADGKNYDTKHCNLSAIIAVGDTCRTSRLGGRVNLKRIPGLGGHRVFCNLARRREQNVDTPHKSKEAPHGY